MFASVVLFTFPWVLDYMMLQANKQREKKMAELPADHVFPEGPIGHMDGEHILMSVILSSRVRTLNLPCFCTVRFRYVL